MNDLKKMSREELEAILDKDVVDLTMDGQRTRGTIAATNGHLPQSEPVATAEPKKAEPTPISYGDEELSRCVEALCKELPYLLDRRPYIAIRAVNYLDPAQYMPQNGVYLSDLTYSQRLIEDVAQLNNQGYVIWYTLNEFPRTKDGGTIITNSMERRKGVKDEDVTRLLTFFVDFDPIRPKGREATDEESNAAQERALATRDWLRDDYGFPEPQIVMSGNGYHVLWDIDFPATEEYVTMVQHAVYVVAGKMQNEAVGGDTSVWNSAQQCKLPGTFSRKTLPTADHPQRLAHTLSFPTERQYVIEDAFRRLIAEHPEHIQRIIEQEEAETATKIATWNAEEAGFTKEQSIAKVEDFLHSNDLVYHIERDGGTRRYRIDGELLMVVTARLPMTLEFHTRLMVTNVILMLNPMERSRSVALAINVKTLSKHGG
jgi:hypothetical protein